MHFASAAHAERIRAVRIVYAQRNVAQQFFIQSFAQLTGGYELSFFAGKRTVVHGERHFHRRILDFYELHGLHGVRLTNGIADVQPFDAGKYHDVARFRRFHGHAVEPFDLIKRYDFLVRTHFFIVVIAHGNRLVRTRHAPFYSADADAPHEFVVIDARNKQLRRTFHVHIHRRNVR